MNEHDRLSPLAVYNNSSLIRVPLTFPSTQEGSVVLYVGDAHMRIFKEKDLPDFIKTSLVQIKLIQGRTEFKEARLRDSWMSNRTGIDSLDNIGWRVNEYLFVVIVNKEDFYSLRGTNDIRKLMLENYTHNHTVQWLRHNPLSVISQDQRLVLDMLDSLSRLQTLEDAQESLKKQYIALSHSAVIEEFDRIMRLKIYRRIDDENARRQSERADQKAFERM